MRQITNVNKDWNFIKEASSVEDVRKSTGKAICLPHTWNNKDGQDGGDDYYRGTCWYKKNLSLPAISKEEDLYLEFCGVAMTAKVYVNGDRLTCHEGGYSTFRVKVTKYALQSEDTTVELIVSADNSKNDRVYPQSADFTFYGGIYRDVNLIRVPKCHIALEYAGGPGVRVEPGITGEISVKSLSADAKGGASSFQSPAEEEILQADALIKTNVYLEGAACDGNESDNAANSAEQSIRFTVLDREKNVVITTNANASVELSMPAARLWNGTKDPYLYTMKVELMDSDGTVSDEIEIPFGIRKMEITPDKGFLLNEREYPLRGVSRHQDRRDAGNALTYDMHKEDLDIIMEMGANSIRLAHYQHAQEFYDLCDERGIVTWAEIPYITMHMEEGRENILSQMKELIVQNFNHPSISVWGLSNEITAASVMDESLLENHRALNDLAHSLDATRPTTMANVFMLETDSEILTIPDVNAYNLYFGWYLGELEENDSFFDEFHTKYPNRPMGFSEYGADANKRFHNTHPDKGDYSEEYQCIYHEHILKMIEARPWLWCTYVWNMFDFAADGRDEGGEHGLNQKGLVSFDRKEKKDAFYLYKAYWSRESFLHICGKSYAARSGDTTQVKVYSNLPEVTLFVNGQEFEKKQGQRIFVFDVPMKGNLELRAVAGDFTDSCTIEKVQCEDPKYTLSAGDNQGNGVKNWFDDIKLDPNFFSINDKFGDLMANSQVAAILGPMMEKSAASRGDIAKKVSKNPMLKRMMAKMTMASMLKQAADAITEEEIKQLNAMLQKIHK